ncbi:MAG: metal-dependent transcriptional regulator [Oscillospiraceae bacterium]
MGNITASKEDYLEVIYDLLQKSTEIRSIDVANALSFSRASVSRAIGNLKQDGFILQQPYGKITLTPSGLSAAKKVRTRHNLIKYYLVNTLCIPENIAEEDACKMEHIISVETLTAIENAAIGHKENRDK